MGHLGLQAAFACPWKQPIIQHRMSLTALAEAYRYFRYGEHGSVVTIEDLAYLQFPDLDETFAEFYERNRQHVQVYEAVPCGSR